MMCVQLETVERSATSTFEMTEELLELERAATTKAQAAAKPIGPANLHTHTRPRQPPYLEAQPSELENGSK